MFATFRPPDRSRAAWLCSALLHIAAAILLVQFTGAIMGPPAHPAGATLVFIPPPKPADAIDRAPLQKPKLTAMAIPKLEPPKPVPIVHTPVAIEAPIVQSPSAMRTSPLIKTRIPDSPVQTASIGGFSPSLRIEPLLPARALTQPAGFDPVQKPGASTKSKSLSSLGGFDGATGARESGSSRTAVVSSAGFASVSTGAIGSPRPQQQTSQAGFGDTFAFKFQPPGAGPPPNQPPDSMPIEITFKPRPVYTDEARRLQIEGEVVVEAVFTASGEIRIVRTIRGLGHGLNESAIAAVRSIRFRPATQHGIAVDSTATIRMNFELAY